MGSDCAIARTSVRKIIVLYTNICDRSDIFPDALLDFHESNIRAFYVQLSIVPFHIYVFFFFCKIFCCSFSLFVGFFSFLTWFEHLFFLKRRYKYILSRNDKEIFEIKKKSFRIKQIWTQLELHSNEGEDR